MKRSIFVLLLVLFLFTLIPQSQVTVEAQLPRPFTPQEMAALKPLFAQLTRALRTAVKYMDTPCVSHDLWYPQYGPITNAQPFQHITCGFPKWVWLNTFDYARTGRAYLMVCHEPFIVENTPVFLPGVYNADNTLQHGGVGWRVKAARFDITPCQPLSTLTQDAVLAAAWTAVLGKLANENPDLARNVRKALGLGPDNLPPAVPEPVFNIVIPDDVKVVEGWEAILSPGVQLGAQYNDVVSAGQLVSALAVPDEQIENYTFIFSVEGGFFAYASQPYNWDLFTDVAYNTTLETQITSLISFGYLSDDIGIGNKTLGPRISLNPSTLLIIAGSLLLGMFVLLMLLRPKANLSR